MISSLVSDIQRFSLHDGPGIRTTVFLQGCHLRCPWCHNPETRPPRPPLLFYADKCIGCRACVEACARGVHSFAADGGHLLAREHCAADGECVCRCPSAALRLAGRRMTVSDVLAEVLEDRAFYGTDGGVTLSGGEPLLQAEFAREILRACKAADVHTAVETSLCYPWSRLEALLPSLDLVMFDIKFPDPARYQHHTGSTARSIRDNLAPLNASGLPLIARTPLLSGLNDSEEDIAQIARQLAPLKNLLYYELLPYHPLGVGKFRALGEPAPDFTPPSAAHLTRLRHAAQAAGVNVR